ncbi:hypothetical protein B0A55_06560 [Friedmanniomyces simplex]|uniref:F-box domain-containing protein n=1 Tax=Friedmanniomyces simplex TaxID=329884 RepID=A0A4U0X3J0_9PEZI|nr:hypothetical protein B0A55_06560 [Friedmanniomyces simplex]
MDGDLHHLPNDFEEIFHGDHSLQTFPLLRLPAEIWLRICEFAVTDSKPINVTKEPKTHDQVALVRQPPLTHTCRLLRHEALPMFYRNNSFEARHFCGHFNEHACPRRWMAAIGMERLKAMGTFSLHTRMNEGFWVGCFERTGLAARVEVTATNVKGQCPRHSHGKAQTLTVTFL